MATSKKAPSKKSSGKTAASTGFSVTLELARETKNTYRFETEDEDAAVNPLYVQKSAFNGADAPQSITLTVKVN